MTDQILSQEEIDALLSSMDKGEIDLEEDEKVETGQVAKYDLTTQSIMLRDQFYALDEVFDKFTTSLHKSLSSSLQRLIEVELVSMEMVRFREILKAFSNPTSFHIFNMEPLIGSALLAIEPTLAFSLIDCMFGGTGKPLDQVREFTLIEQRMMRRFSVEVLENLEKAWEFVLSLSLVLKKTETNPEFLHLFVPNDLLIVIVFSINGDEFSGNIHLCISYLMLEPIKEKLSSGYSRKTEMEHTWGSQLQELLKDTPVKLSVELGRTTTNSVRDLLKLQAGDVVKLNTGPRTPVTVLVEDIPKFKGFPGVVKGNRAVQISEFISQKEGSS
jgi:flagellar motor switch protein FliM